MSATSPDVESIPFRFLAVLRFNADFQNADIQNADIQIDNVDFLPLPDSPPQVLGDGQICRVFKHFVANVFISLFSAHKQSISSQLCTTA
jgi:hypothetical protein